MNCSNINSIDLANWTVGNVTNFSMMYSGCSNLTDLYVSKWNVINALNVEMMFYGCKNLVNIDVSNWSLVNVTSTLRRMFSYCNNLSNESIDSIINMCLNATNISTSSKNLRPSNGGSPFNYTNIAASRYETRKAELTAAGWTY